MIIILLLGLGLILGSFINATIWRLHEQEEVEEALSAKKLSKAKRQALEVRARELSISQGRSMCSHCGHPLAAKDLVPFFSWACLRGRCRYCGVKIQDNPLIELATPALFVLSYLAWPYSLQTAEGRFRLGLWLIILTGFVALTVYDYRWKLLPNKIVFPLIAVAAFQLLLLATVFHGGWRSILGAVWGCLISSGLFYVLYQVSDGRWIGGGDVKLGIVIGLLLGGPAASLLMLFSASLLGSIVGLPYLIKGKRQMEIPFGPFLIAATIIAVLFGSKIIQAYLNLLVY